VKIKTIGKASIYLLIGLTFNWEISILNITTVRAQSISIPEIGWNSHIGSFDLDRQENLGKVFTFRCRPVPINFDRHGIYGNNIYTSTSPICRSAMHAGMMTEEGGVVTVKLVLGQTLYTGIERNEIESSDAGAAERSITFIGTPVVTEDSHNNQKSARSSERTPPSFVERALRQGVQRGIEEEISDAFRGLFR
jgi:hypothetical protein